MSSFLYVTRVLALLWFLVTFCGYVIYRTWELPKWEDGIRLFLTKGIVLVYETFTNKPHPDSVPNTTLILTKNEVLELIKRLSAHPFDTPCLNRYAENENGIFKLDITAMGLVPTYKELTQTDIAKISSYIIQTYYLESRDLQVVPYIQVATPTRLLVEIPLSVEGKKLLDTQRASQKPSVPKQNKILEESVETSDDKVSRKETSSQEDSGK